MPRFIRHVSVCALLVAAALPAVAADEGPPEGLDFKGRPPQPEMALAPCTDAPTIDGEIAADEWAQAACISSLTELGKANGLAYPPTHVYVAYDDEYFYFAFQCPKAVPGWYRAKSRFRDSPVYLDRNYVEFYLSPPTERGEHAEVYQFNFNAYGAIADWRRIQEIGLTQPGYNPQIDLETHETDDLWTIEGRVRTEDLAEGGLRPGATWRTNFARSWPQRAWSYRPGFFIERRNMGYLHLRKDAPAIQWLDFSPLHTGTLDVKVRVRNLSDVERTFRLSAQVTGDNANDPITSDVEEITLPAGQSRELRLASDETFAGRKGHVELTCTDDDGTRYYHQYLRFTSHYADAARGRPEAMEAEAAFPRRLDVGARYGQLAGAVEVKADVWFLRRAGLSPESVRVRVVPAAEDAPAVAERTLTHFQKDMAIALIELPEAAPFGDYRVQVEAMDAEGEVIETGEAEFTRLDLASEAVNVERRSRGGRIFDWIGNDVGEREGVLPPWTPVRVDGGAMEVWGRRHELAASGLPAQIRSGETDLLAGPITLTAKVDGKALALAAEGDKTPEIAPNLHMSEATWTGSLVGDGWSVDVRGMLDYDGLIRYTLDVDCEQPVAMDSLVLDIPVKGELAKILNLHSGMAELGDEPGLLWESRSACDNALMGTLTPHVWVGDTFRGLAWIADHTRGWYEQPHESVVTIERASDVAHLRVHLVRGPATVESTTMEFALIATPTKPLPQGWRKYPHEPGWTYRWFRGWWGMCVKDDGRIECSWDDPTAAHRTTGLDEAFGENRSGGLCLPYNNPNFTVPHPMPWAVQNISPVSKLLWEDWVRMPARSTIKPVASYRDWAVDNMAYWMKLQAYGGWYVDESYGGEDYDVNLLNGSGWFDREGNLRGSYHSLAVRDLFKRMYTVSHRHSRTGMGFILNHVSTFGMAPHVMSWARAGCFGEGMGVHEDGDSILDAVSLRNLRFFSGKAWGYFGTYFGFYHTRDWGDKTSEEKERSRKSVRMTYGALMLHDMTPNDGWIVTGWGPAPEMKRRFGIAAADVTFRGYWYPDCPVGQAGPIKASAYVRPDKVLIVAVNTDTTARHDGRLMLDGEATGFGDRDLTAVDALSGDDVPVTDGAIFVDLPARDVAYFVVRPK